MNGKVFYMPGISCKDRSSLFKAIGGSWHTCQTFRVIRNSQNTAVSKDSIMSAAIVDGFQLYDLSDDSTTNDKKSTEYMTILKTKGYT